MALLKITQGRNQRKIQYFYINSLKYHQESTMIAVIYFAFVGSVSFEAQTVFSFKVNEVLSDETKSEVKVKVRNKKM